MTIDEAIEHAKGVARTCYDGQCAADHIQLAEWLRMARGADKAARWYTAKIRELENRSKALETLIGEKEDENAKLRESVRNLLTCVKHEECEESCPNYEPIYTDYGYEKNGSTVVESEYLGCCTVGLENCNSMLFDTDEYLRELGIEVPHDN